jgi:membrane fusion protein (multidrug efflux system)
VCIGGMTFFRLGSLACLLMVGCGPQTPPPAFGPLPVSVITVSLSEVSQSSVASGQVEGVREVEVRARITGILQTVDYREGGKVKAGDLLFKIDPATYQAAESLAKAQVRQEAARATQARAEANRQQLLLSQGATGRKEAEDALTAAVMAEALRDAAEAKHRLAQLDLSYCEIRSPIDGVAGRRLRTEGALVNPVGPDGLLTTVVQSTEVWIRFGLSEVDFNRLFNGRADAASGAEVRLLLPNGTPSSVVGAVDFAATEVDARMGTIQMRARFDNAQGALLAGQFARVRVTGLKAAGGCTIPYAALVQVPTGRVVMVVGEGNKAEVRPVALGDVSGATVTILSGLKEGDQLIVDQLQKLRAGAPVVPHPAATASIPATK